MKTHSGRFRPGGIAALLGALALALALVTALADAAPAAASAGEDRILPVEQYTSEKARRLATTYAGALRDFNARLYHCMPWVEVQKQSIGFFRPKGATQDHRYLSIRLYIEQEPSPAFSGMRVEERASSMFSRYVGPLLQRMTSPALLGDPALDGFTVILEWLKQTPQGANARPIHETIAVFVDKAVAADYLAGVMPSRDLAARARVLGWDGETALGPLRLAAWDDNFVATYRVQNYQLAPGVTCP